MAESSQDLIGFIASSVETMRDQMGTIRDQMATKSDIVRLEERIDTQGAAIRGDIEQVQFRLDSMRHDESSRFEHVEGELSRLRSAIYLLGKDRPDILRLLGHNDS